METVDAQSCLEVWLDCPYCETYQNRYSDLHEYLDETLRAENCEVDIVCENTSCGKHFIVRDIHF